MQIHIGACTHSHWPTVFLENPGPQSSLWENRLPGLTYRMFRYPECPQGEMDF